MSISNIKHIESLFANNKNGDFMKKIFKKNLKIFFILISVILCCCTIMIGGAYFYLELSLNTADADTTESNIPYAAPLPDSAGILLTLPDNSGYMVYLDFYGEQVLIAAIENTNEPTTDYFGYPVSYTVKADYNLVEGLIDRLGGLEIYDNGETLRYTGIQVLEKVHSFTNNTDLKKMVVNIFFDRIAEVGFSKGDFVYIIENSDTDLTVPDCYYWPPYLTDIAGNARFIN